MRLNKTWHIHWYLEKKWGWNPKHFEVVTLSGSKRVQVAICFISKLAYSKSYWDNGKLKREKSVSPQMQIVVISDGIQNLTEENINKEILKDIDAHMIHEPHENLVYTFAPSIKQLPPGWRKGIQDAGWRELYDVDYRHWGHTRTNNLRSYVRSIGNRPGRF